MSKLNERLTLVANLSVVVGIVFLAVELQQNTSAVQAQTQVARGVDSPWLYSSSAQSPKSTLSRASPVHQPSSVMKSRQSSRLGSASNDATIPMVASRSSNHVNPLCIQRLYALCGPESRVDYFAGRNSP